MTQDEALQTICIHASDIVDVCTHLRSLESAPQWLRHEGGAMPEGADREDVMLLVSYDDGEVCPYWDDVELINWAGSFWYMVIPTPPEPPKAKTERWAIKTGDNYLCPALMKDGVAVATFFGVNYAEQMAIVDALNKQAQGGGE